MFIGSILFVAVSIVSSYGEDSKDAASIKRAPMGFQGMRGKKDLTSVENDDFSKRAPMGFQGMRGKKESIAPDIEEHFMHDELNKRAPMGFQGMRGKKDFLTPEFEDSYFREEYEKRAPMGFQGMRGKKTTYEDDYYKRAPMGFQGMRGKKSLEEVLDEIEKKASLELQDAMGNKMYTDGDRDWYQEKRARAMGFQGMRGKKDDIPTEWEKRAPMGFQGMRGKKTLLDEMEELEKRAVMGFQGTRGKKDSYDNYVDYLIDPFDYDKRAPMGFQGMRGKKDSDKRAPMGFQGMRGKRNVGQIYGSNGEFEKRTSIDYRGTSDDRRNSVQSYQFEKRSPFRYFGMRGKKNPRWEIRGKFVGVRGKKWAPARYEDDARLKNFIDNIERIDVEADSSEALDLQ